MNNAITYGDVERLLTRFGFIGKSVDAMNTVFLQPENDALVILPSNRSDVPVRPSHMAIVRRTILEKGIASAPEIDAALKPEPVAA